MAGGFLTTVAGVVVLSVQQGTLALVPPDNEWDGLLTFVPMVVGGI